MGLVIGFHCCVVVTQILMHDGDASVRLEIRIGGMGVRVEAMEEGRIGVEEGH